MNCSGFLISLDFELSWGFQDVGERVLDKHRERIRYAPEALRGILDVLGQYGIKATVAYVGAIGENGEAAWHQPNMVNELAENPMMELATHTYSHYRCQMPRSTAEGFEADLNKALASAPKHITAIVFPNNEVNDRFLPICKRMGLTHYRGRCNERLRWLNRVCMGHLMIRALRLIDTYIPVLGRQTFKGIQYVVGMVEVPSSMFLRPYCRQFHWLERLKMWRIKWSMTQAAQRGELFHLWWHPHNYGQNLAQNLAQLGELCQHYEMLHKQYPDFKSHFFSEL